MKFLTTILTLLLTSSMFGTALNAQRFNRDQFYAAMAGSNLTVVSNMESHLTNLSIEAKEGFDGALQMKKAGLVKPPSQKISLFKAGHKKLEQAIKKDTNNGELRFLRLMIQENAPKSVKYRGEIESDSQYLIQHFNNLSPEVQKALLAYTKSSKVLKPEDF